MSNKDLSIDSLPPKKPLMDAEAMAELDAGMQKGVDEDGGVQIEKMEESSASPPLSKEDEDVHVPPVDQASAILPPLQDCYKSAPIQDERGPGESKVTADDGRVDIEPKAEGPDDMRQGKAPVEVEQEPDVRATAEIEQEPDVEAPLDTQPNASDPLETESLRQDLLVIQPDPHFLDDFKPDQHVVDKLESSQSRREVRIGDADVGFITITPTDGEIEFGRVDPSVPEEANIAEPQTHFVDDATELSCMGEENQEHVNDTAGPFSQEQILDPNVGGPAVDEKISLEVADEGANDSQQGATQLVDTDEGGPGVSVEKLCSEEAGEGMNDLQQEALQLAGTDEGNSGVYVEKLSLEEAGEGMNDSQEGALPLVDTDEGNPGVSVEKLSSEEAGEGANDLQGALQLVDTDEGNPGVSAEKLTSEEAGEGANDLQQIALQVVDTDDSNPRVSVEHDSVEPPLSKELNDRVDQESPNGIVLDEPSTSPVSHEYALTKEPSLSTPAMEALTDVDNNEPLHEQENCEVLEDSAQCLDAEDKHEESAGGGSAEGTSNEPEVKVDSNEQEAENNSFDQDVPLAAAADSACEALAPSGQELMTVTPPADEQDGKDKELGNDVPFVFEQDLGTAQCAANEEPSFEPLAEQELDIETPNSAVSEPFEKNLDSGSSSIELEMPAETHEKGDEGVCVVAEKDDINEQEVGLDASSIKQAGDVRGVAAVSAPVEDVITSNLDEVVSENEPGGLALNSEQGIDNPDMKDASLADVSGSHGKQSDSEGLSSKQEISVVQLVEEEETACSEDEVKIDGFNEQLDEHDPNKRLQYEQGSLEIIPCSNNVTEANYSDKNCEQDRQDISRTLIPTQFAHTANGNPNDVLESSVTPEAPNKIRLSAHMFDNGDSFQSFASTDKGEKAEGSHVGLSTEPIVELGKVCDGMNKLEAPITVLENGTIYHGSVIEDGKYIPSEPLSYNSENKDKYNVLSASGTQSVKTEDKDLNAGEERERVGGSNGIAADMDATGTWKPLVLENGFLDGDLVGTEYMNGLGSASIADRTKENAEAFHNERSREVSLSLVVPQQRDALENVDNKCTTESVTIAQRTNWWGCCGMLDLLLRKD